MNEVIKGLPVIALKGMTILPYMVIHFDINRKNLIETVEYAMLHGQKIFITGYAVMNSRRMAGKNSSGKQVQSVKLNR